MRRTLLIVTLLALLIPCWSSAQVTMRLRILDESSKKAIPFAQATTGGQLITVSDSLGIALITLPAGTYTIALTATNYATQSAVYTFPDTTTHFVYLEASTKDLEEVTVVSSTRSNQSIENSTMKVEVLGKEEVSEEVAIKPANIASLLGDVSGVQIQQSSAVSGNSNVRIQGLQGRYTQILRDGMPLYDGFSGGFGILTIPPLDLKQIELIKGSASTLYGGGAIGGLVNLISKRPTFNQEADIIANYTSLGEVDANAYIAKRNQKVGYTFFAGYAKQVAKDVDGDGFSDVPNAQSVLLHPKFFYYPNDKTIISAGYSGTFDNRKGGDMKVLNGQSDTTHQFFEENISQRHTGEFSIEHFYDNDTRLVIKGSVSYFQNKTTNFEYAAGTFSPSQLSYYNEASYNKTVGKATYVCGINILGDDYQNNSQDAYINDFSNFTIGAFGQYSLRIKDKSTFETGLRIDHHNTKGFFALPRVAYFHRFNEKFATRLGFGMGYKTPNPFVQQDIEYNPLRIVTPDDNLKSEISYGYNAEINYKKDWDNHHTLFINHAFFYTQVNNPIVFIPDVYWYNVRLANSGKPLSSLGSDTYLKLTIKKWELYSGFTYTLAQWDYPGSKSYVPLTPRSRIAMVLVKEIEEKWRFGLEGSLTGTQYRYDGTTTPTYFFAAIMILHNLGKHVSLVLNIENATDYRMSKVESIYTGSITIPEFKPLWAPIDGRVVNFSVRWKL